jgi:hypothetical protein
MRLINCNTLEMEEYSEADAPPYVIMSHTWGKDEVTFQEWNSLNREHLSTLKPGGFLKIKRCCEVVLLGEMNAAEATVNHCWIDTCCIDKTSSSELSEAINRMFRWYEKSVACFVYLSDVSLLTIEDLDTYISSNSHNKLYEIEEFAYSRWWTRGWTLQELIAPDNLYFFNASWQELGNKSDYSVLIHDITDIPEHVLKFQHTFRRCSLARRMSWASHRQTTREEDVAYSLLGIFGVNMPLLYGEGQNAFLRLQEEILKQSDDQSLFAWSVNGNPAGGRPSRETLCGLLASHPSYFAQSAAFRPAPLAAGVNLSRFEVVMTNVGIKLSLPTFRSADGVYGVLNVTSSEESVIEDNTESINRTWDLVGLRLWPMTEAGGKLARMGTPFIISLTSVEYMDEEPELFYMLRSGHINGVQLLPAYLSIEFRELNRSGISMQWIDCHYSTIPVRRYTSYKIDITENRIQYWRASLRQHIAIELLFSSTIKALILVQDDGGEPWESKLSYLVLPMVDWSTLMSSLASGHWGRPSPLRDLSETEPLELWEGRELRIGRDIIGYRELRLTIELSTKPEAPDYWLVCSKESKLTSLNRAGHLLLSWGTREAPVTESTTKSIAKDGSRLYI